MNLSDKNDSINPVVNRCKTSLRKLNTVTGITSSYNKGLKRLITGIYIKSFFNERL